MGAAAAFGFGEEGDVPQKPQRPKVDYNMLLRVTFFDMVKCDSQRPTVVNRGQRVGNTTVYGRTLRVAEVDPNAPPAVASRTGRTSAFDGTEEDAD